MKNHNIEVDVLIFVLVILLLLVAFKIEYPHRKPIESALPPLHQTVIELPSTAPYTQVEYKF